MTGRIAYYLFLLSAVGLVLMVAVTTIGAR